jgi:UDP-N-acetylmuramate dehydrogenase
MEIQERVPLSSYTTLKIGGPAAFFVAVKTESELREAFAWAREQRVRAIVIGEGSNILASDEPLEALVIKMAIKGIEVTEIADAPYYRAGAGDIFDELVSYTCAHGHWGLENLSGIPGTVGATPIQNVGAYGVEVKDLITEVRAYDIEMDDFITLTNAECAFGYRHSLFKENAGKRYVVTGVTYKLSSQRKPQLAYRDLVAHFNGLDTNSITPEIVRSAVLAIRAKKFPDWRTIGTAGSFFKNPTVSPDLYAALRAEYPLTPGYEQPDGQVKIPLGWILDHVCAMRGVREGAVGTSPAQALVLINYGGATAHEVAAFAEKIAACVHDRTRISIEWEVTRIS